MNSSDARARFAASPVAVLATAGADSSPHLVPITFALLGEETVVSAIDHKPKRTTALKRLRNIEENGAVSLLVHHYSDDWSALWWARADGTAQIVSPGELDEVRARGIAALCERYPDYRAIPPSGALVVVEVARWSGWSAAGRDGAVS